MSGVGSGFSSISFFGERSSLISSCGVNAYFHVISFWNLKGIAKSFIFLRATLIAGFSSWSKITFFDFSFSCASFSIDFRFEVSSSSFCF